MSEAAALLAAQADLSALVVEKHKLRGPDGKNATVHRPHGRYVLHLFTPVRFLKGNSHAHRNRHHLPKKLAYGRRATAFGAHTMGLLKSPTAWLRTALAAFFFSDADAGLAPARRPVGLHLVGAMPVYLLFGFIPTLFGFGWACWCKPLVFEPQTWAHLAVNFPEPGRALWSPCTTPGQKDARHQRGQCAQARRRVPRA